jgi:hypothetical protein
MVKHFASTGTGGRYFTGEITYEWRSVYVYTTAAEQTPAMTSCQQTHINAGCWAGKYGTDPAIRKSFQYTGFACDSCSQGMYGPNDGSISSSDCLECPAGYYGTQYAQSYCYECEAGYFLPTTGLFIVEDGYTTTNACGGCPLGFWSPAGSGSCPLTIADGATSVIDGIGDLFGRL